MNDDADWASDEEIEKLELYKVSTETLVVNSFESFALGAMSEHPDGTPDELRNVEIVVFDGRWNRTEKTATLAVLLVEPQLVQLIEGLQHGLQAMQRGGP